MIRYKFADKITGLDAEEPDVRETGLQNFLVHLPQPDELSFDAEEVVLRSRLRGPHKEPAPAAAEINFDRTIAGEDLTPVQRVEPVGRFVDRAVHQHLHGRL